MYSIADLFYFTTYCCLNHLTEPGTNPKICKGGAPLHPPAQPPAATYPSVSSAAQPLHPVAAQLLFSEDHL